MDKVVAVLRILLEPQRRWALQVFLHKAILRLLFEASSAEARRLFAHEWAQRTALKMHADVVHEWVRLAVGRLASTDADKSQIAWTIAEEVGRARGEFAPTTVLLLLLPSWVPEQPFVGQRMIEPLFRVEVPNSEVVDSFGQLHSKWLAEPLLYFGAATVAPIHVEQRSRLAMVAHGILSTQRKDPPRHTLSRWASIPARRRRASPAAVLTESREARVSRGSVLRYERSSGGGSGPSTVIESV